MANWQDYLKLMRSLTRTLEELAQVERDKNAAASAGDLRGVEECMKREQALSLSLRSAEQKRGRMIRELGLEDVPLLDILDHCPPGMDLETKEVAEELRRQYDIFRASSNAARDALECNLRVIEQTMKKMGQSPPAPQSPESGAPPVRTDFRA